MFKIHKSRNSNRSTLFSVTELTTVRFAASMILVASRGMDLVLVRIRQVFFSLWLFSAIRIF